MKQHLLSLLLLAGATSAQAQTTIPDGTFATWTTCTPYSSGQTQNVGEQPQGWNVSNVAGMKVLWSWMGTTTIAKKADGPEAGTTAVCLTNTPNPMMASQIVPGYLTLGTPWNTSKSGKDNDGGTFGGVAFTGHPDLLTFQYLRTAASADAAAVPSTVYAYSWKGTWSQDNVPANVYTSSPTKITMTDRDRNILGIATAFGDTPSATDGAMRVGYAEASITSVTDDAWASLALPFSYEKNADGQLETPEKLNIIFAASNYFDAEGVVSGTSLTVANVRLVYHSHLRALSYAGYDLDLTSPADADAHDLAFDFSTLSYDPALLSYEAAGCAATVDTLFDAATHVLTITVKGENLADDATNVHTYRLQFSAVPTGLTAPALSSSEEKAYTLDGRKARKGQKGLLIQNGKKVIVK